MTYQATKLEPCPFCGSDAAFVPRAVNLVLQKDPSDPKFGVSVICGKCGAEAPNMVDEAHAAAKWNRRAALPPQAKAEPAGVSEREAFERWHLNYWRNERGFGGVLTEAEHRARLRLSGDFEVALAAWQARAILSAAPSTGVREAQVQSSEPSACSHCDDLGWEWEHGLGNESWKVACHLHCAATAKWLADEHGVETSDGGQQ